MVGFFASVAMLCRPLFNGLIPVGYGILILVFFGPWIFPYLLSLIVLFLGVMKGNILVFFVRFFGFLLVKGVFCRAFIFLFSNFVLRVLRRGLSFCFLFSF